VPSHKRGFCASSDNIVLMCVSTCWVFAPGCPGFSACVHHFSGARVLFDEGVRIDGQVMKIRPRSTGILNIGHTVNNGKQTR
jgi:hypothetical protein